MTPAFLQRDAQRRAVWSILEKPSVYKLVQRLLAPGTQKSLHNEIGKFARSLKHLRRHLDIGCGPNSLLWSFELNPVGLDLGAEYLKSFRSKGGWAVAGSAGKLPFSEGSFDTVWNFGLLHHLSDDMARHSIREMVRVVRPGGSVTVFDGVMPEFFLSRPVAWILRKLDRGRHMRTQEALESIVSERNGLWSFKRFTYSWWGHEGVLCRFQKPEVS